MVLPTTTASPGSSSLPPNQQREHPLTALVQRTLKNEAEKPLRLSDQASALLLQHQISMQQRLPNLQHPSLLLFICDTPQVSPIRLSSLPCLPLSPTHFSPLALRFWCGWMEQSQKCRRAFISHPNSRDTLTVDIYGKPRVLTLKELYGISEGLVVVILGTLLDGGRVFTNLSWPLIEPPKSKQTVIECFERLVRDASPYIHLTLGHVPLPEVKTMFAKFFPTVTRVVNESPDALWAIPSIKPERVNFEEMAHQIQQFLLFFSRYHPQLASLLDSRLSKKLFAPSSLFLSQISQKDQVMVTHLKALLEICNKLACGIDLEGLKKLYATLYEAQSDSHQSHHYPNLLKSATEKILAPIDEESLHCYPTFQVGMWWMIGVENGLKILIETLHHMCWSCLTPSLPTPLIKKTLGQIFSMLERLHQRSQAYAMITQSTLDELSASPEWEQVASGCQYYSYNLSFEKCISDFLESLLPKFSGYLDQLKNQTLPEAHLSEFISKLISVLWELQKQRIFIVSQSPQAHTSEQTTHFWETILDPRLEELKENMEAQYFFQQAVAGAALDRLHAIFGERIAKTLAKQTELETAARERAEAALMAAPPSKPVAASHKQTAKKKKKGKANPIQPIHTSSWDRFVTGPNEPVFAEGDPALHSIRSEEKWQTVTRGGRGGLINRPLIPNLPPVDHRLAGLAELVNLYPGYPPIESACLWGRLLEQSITSIERQATFDTICEELNRSRQILEALCHHILTEAKVTLSMSHDLIPLALDIFHHPKISLPIKEALNAIWPVLSLLNLSNIIIHYPFSCGSFSHPDSERFYDHLMAMHHHPDLAQHDIVIDSCLSAIEILSQGVLGHTVPTAAAVDIPTAAPLTSLFFDPPIAAVPDLLEEEGMVVPPSLPCYSIDSIESATAALNECRDWALVWQLRNPAGERGSALRYDLRNDALQNALLLIERLLEKLHHPRQPSDEFGALALLELIWRAAKELCVGRLIHLPAYNESGLHVIQSCRYTNSLRQLSDLIALYTEPPPPAPLWVDQCHVPISYPFPYAHHVKRLPELQTLISSMIQPAETERRELMNEVYATAIYPGLHYLLLIARQFGSC